MGILGLVAGLLTLGVFSWFILQVCTVAWAIVTGTFKEKFDGKHPDEAAPLLRVLFTKLLPASVPLILAGVLNGKENHAAAPSKAIAWPVINSLSDILSLVGDLIVGAVGLVVMSPFIIILFWLGGIMMMYGCFTAIHTAVHAAFSILPLLSRLCIGLLLPPLYVLHLLKQASNWLADQAIEGVARMTNYFPKQQRPVIRWLAQRHPARFQKAAAKARHAAASHHAEPAKPDAKL